jgi:hypothetical protein
MDVAFSSNFQDARSNCGAIKGVHLIHTNFVTLQQSSALQ